MAGFLSSDIGSTIMGIIIVLIFLLLAVLVIGLLVMLARRGKSAASPGSQSTAAVPAATKNAPLSATDDKISSRTIAIIMAAVSAASGSPVSGLRFTAVRRKRSVSSKWADAATNDIINAQKYFLN